MATIPESPRAKEALLGLEEGFKNWLRPPDHIPVGGDGVVAQDNNSSNGVDVKSELKEENVTVAVDIENKVQSKDDDEKSKDKNDEDTASVNSVKEEDNSNNKLGSIKNDNKTDFQYKTVMVKSYSSSSTKEEPIEDISTMFMENILNYEKQKFHQNIFNEMMEDIGKNKFEELQNQYIEYLRKATDLETFTCLKCEYQTIHKANLKSHLLLIHKKDLEVKMFQCTVSRCYFKAKSLTGLKKHHTMNHEEDEDDYFSELEAHSDNDWEEFEEKPKKSSAKKRKKVGFTCDLCSFECKERKSLKTHAETHRCPDNPKKFLCYMCDYGVTFKPYLQKHLLKMHKVITKGAHKFKEMKCPYCEYKTDTKSCLDIHLITHKSPDQIKWLSCTFCNFKAKYKTSLRQHLRTHRPPEEQQEMKKFMCDVCSKRFKRREALETHSLTHKSINEVSKIYKCPQCKFQSKFKGSLRAHMVMHEEPSFICDTCGFRTRKKYNYELHTLTHKSESEVTLYRCSICSYYSKSKVYFKAHMARGTHLGRTKRSKNSTEKPTQEDWICDICGVKFSTKGNLKNHSVVHKTLDEIEIFKCSECSFETRHKGNLVKHERQHKETEPNPAFKCKICGLQLKKEWNLRMHLVTHKSAHEVELFTCYVCSYQTKFKEYLKAHLRKRHGITSGKQRNPIRRKVN